MNTDKPVILFDGMCNLCSSSVQFVIKRDKKNLFQFASLQSAYGQQLLQRFHLPARQFNSFVLYKKGRLYLRSTAALLVAKELSGLWPLAAVFIFIPKGIRNSLYDWIAANRYKWFGQKTECWIPSPELRSRFIDQ